MEHSVRQLHGDEVLARDGRIGSLQDLCIDARRWAVRYLVVDTGRWLQGEPVLLRPDSVLPELSSGDKLRLALTREAVERAGHALPPDLPLAGELIGFSIEARDGTIGEVRDFTVDERSWAIRDVVVDTTRFWPGGEVRVHPAYVDRVDRQARTLHVLLTRDEVKLSGAPTPRS